MRSKIFISHATPKDNAFATWLSSRLSMAGFEVWCDANKLLGGEDFWKEIERTLRNEAAKFLIVISENAYSESNVLRDGIAKELALADIVKKQIQDPYFIVPIRLDGTSYGDFSIELLRTNGVDCSSNWAAGFSRVLEIFERDQVQKANKASASLAAWRSVHQHHTRAISDQTEELQSNWLPITHLPESLYFYEAPGIRWSAEPRVIASQCALPAFAHGQLLASFALRDEMQLAVGAEFPLRDRGNLPLANYLRGWTNDILGVEPRDARNQVSSLVRQAWDLRMRRLGLWDYGLANGQLAWWFPCNVPEDGQLRFTDFNGKQRRRTSTGIKGQKVLATGELVPRNYWHLGFTAQPMIGDRSVLKLQSRIILTDDGKTPVANKTRLNGLRRSLTKMWFNDRWRGLLLGFVNFIVDGADEISLPVSCNERIVIAPQLISFSLGHGISSDPVNENLSDELAETYDQEEQNLRLSDPVFASLLDDEEQDDE
ncbi:MAG: toll/interleukin-1 receptor domain-containing protein [Novosphingobium sp.]